jgi:hypothetical protein
MLSKYQNPALTDATNTQLVLFGIVDVFFGEMSNNTSSMPNKEH